MLGRELGTAGERRDGSGGAGDGGGFGRRRAEAWIGEETNHGIGEERMLSLARFSPCFTFSAMQRWTLAVFDNLPRARIDPYVMHSK
jgi:hypothetical protein